MSVFGQITTAIEVQEAVVSTIKTWIEDYLADRERKDGLEPRKIAKPKSYVLSDDGSLNKKPEDQTPTVVVLCPGTANQPLIEGDGTYRIGWLVNVAVIVSARDHKSTQELAKRYAAVMRALLVQNASLGGFSDGVTWRGERYDDLSAEDDRTIAATVNVFEVLVPDVVQAGAGLRTPSPDPYDDEPTLPTVGESEVELQPTEAT